MGISGVSLGSLLVILLIVMLLFGTKRMRTMGEDLGEAVKGFKKGLKEIESEDQAPSEEASESQDVSSKQNIEQG